MCSSLLRKGQKMSYLPSRMREKKSSKLSVYFKNYVHVLDIKKFKEIIKPSEN